MTSYQFPEVAPEPVAPPRTVYTVASGDLRPSANIKCWPVQQQLEADVGRAVESFGWNVVRGHPFDEEAGHGFIDSQRKGLEVFATLPPDAPAAGGRRGVAVQPPRPRRTAHPPRSDHGRGQLERDVPGTRRLVEPDGESDQGRCRVFVAVECRLHRRVGARRAAHLAGDRHAGPRREPCPRPAGARPDPSTRSPSVGPWPTSCVARRRSSASSTRAAWGCTTRSSMTSC